MSPSRGQCSTWARLTFARDEGGATAVVFALSLTVLIGLTGMAVDGARWMTARKQHALAIDTALLTGVRLLQLDASNTTGALAAATTYYQGNLPRGAKIIDNTVQFVQPDSTTSVTFTGVAFVETTLLRAVGISRLPISVPAKAVGQRSGLNKSSNLELAVMLDVTGSMCDNGAGPCTSGVKIDGLRKATSDLATIVLGTTSSTYTSRIALVPFSGAVRIDADGTNGSLMRTLTNLPQTWSGWYNQCKSWTSTGSGNGEMSYGGACTGGYQPVYVTNWKLRPCVTERFYWNGPARFDASDIAPSAGNWLNGHGGDRSVLSFDSSDSALTSSTGRSAGDPTGTWNYSANGNCEQIMPGNEILPLTSNLKAVTDRVATLQPYGMTAGALGTAWAQYLLSPNWGSIWTGSQRPGAYADTTTRQSNGAPLLRKVAVLMTDGSYNSFRSSTGDSQQTISDMALAVCTNMKNNGIEVYTVGFALDQLSGSERTIAETTLKACGTDVSHFYSSLTASDLQTAFRDIALKMVPVRLSQ